MSAANQAFSGQRVLVTGGAGFVGSNLVRLLIELQGDTVSLWAKRLVAALDEGYPGDAGRAAALLRGWDGSMAGSGGAALFAIFERQLQRAVFEDEARQHAIARFGTRWRLLRLLEGRLGTAAAA